MIDTNVSYGFWPFQSFPYQSLKDLAQALRRTGVITAWVSSTDAILAPDPAISERRLFAEIREIEGLRPVKVVHPGLTGEIARLEAVHHRESLAAVKIYPSYHQTPLTAAFYHEVAECCQALGLPLLVVVRVNDERNQPPLMQVPSLQTDEIIAFAHEHPGCRLVALGADKLEVMELLEGPGNLSFDLSYLDGGSILEEVLERSGTAQMVYGSNAPFFYPEAAALKLRYSDLPRGFIERLKEGAFLEA